LPLCRWMMSLQMASPRPVPPIFFSLAVSNC